MKLRFSALLFIMILAISVNAYSNGLGLNSIGPKGFGMGGAFVGIANDYSAIYWNPAGLTQMQNNFIGAFVADIIPMGTYKFPEANIDAKAKTIHYFTPGLVGGYHFTLVENLVFGLGVYVPSGLGTEWDGNDLVNINRGYVNEWKTKIGIVDITPALAYKLSDQFSIGAALNVYYGMFDLKKPAGGGQQYKESSHGWGAALTLSVLGRPTESFSFGFSYRTKAKVLMRGTAEIPTLAAIPGVPISSNFDRAVGWPMWLAIGVAYRPTSKLVLAVDLQFTEWSATEDKFTTEYTMPSWRKLLYPSGQNVMVLHWNDETQFRVGADYSVTDQFNVRAGFYIDPAPAPDQTLNILFPNISYNGITFGLGYKVGSFVFDAAGEYLFGTDREIPLASVTSYNMPGTHGMNVPAFSFGAGYEF
jgi:long-chain fatty acid transport protein